VAQLWTIEIFTIELSAGAPSVDAVEADSVTSTGAILNANVGSNLLATQVTFQYSNDPTLAAGVINTSPQNLAASGVKTLVSIPITGLSSGLTYYYRAVATNSLGTTAGGIVSFMATDASVGYRFSQLPTNNATTINGATLGSQFSVGNSCTVTHLGVYDHNQDGLAANTPVGLWSASGVLLASTTVQKHDPLNRSCRYHELSAPVALAANARYYVGAYYPTSDYYGWQPLTFATDARIAFISYGYRTGGLAIPNERQGSEGDGFNGYFGANFLLGPAINGPVADAGPDQNVDQRDHRYPERQLQS
jgi:hypothetical protein